LTAEQEKEIQRVLWDRTPDQLKMPFALWRRAAVGELIEQKVGIKVPVRRIGHDLKRWGFTPQIPIRKAYEQRPAEIKA
jgi:transposase